MDQRNIATVTPAIEIVTKNRYMKVGLQAILEEAMDQASCEREGSTSDVDTSLTIILIDVGYLDIFRAGESWLSLTEKVRDSDHYAFISSSLASFDDIPHLTLRGPISEIRRSLVRMIHSFNVSKPQQRPDLFSRLSNTERRVMHCLVYEYSVETIHRLLQCNKKSVYNARKQLMKKYNLVNRTELRHMLRVYDFIRSVNAVPPKTQTCRVVNRLYNSDVYLSQKVHDGSEINEI